MGIGEFFQGLTKLFESQILLDESDLVDGHQFIMAKQIGNIPKGATVTYVAESKDLDMSALNPILITVRYEQRLHTIPITILRKTQPTAALTAP